MVINFQKEYGVDRKEDKAGVDQDTDEEDMEGLILDHKRERQWRMFFEDNDRGVDDQKVILHEKRWDVYTRNKEALIKGGYYMEVSGSERKKAPWYVKDNHVVEEGKEHDEIGLRGFDFNGLIFNFF